MTYKQKVDTKEYFVHELDSSKVKADRSLLGTYWFVNRYIWRVGYMFEPQMLVGYEVEKEAEELLLDVFTRSIWQWHDYDLEKVKPIAKNILQNFQDKDYPLPMFKARGVIAKRKRDEYGEDALWRRMWFRDFWADFPYHEDILVRLDETQRVLTGKYYAPSGGYDSYSGEYDYEPGGLSPVFHQTLFKVTVHDPLVSGWKPRHFMKERLVHPNDLLPVLGDETILEDDELIRI